MIKPTLFILLFSSCLTYRIQVCAQDVVPPQIEQPVTKPSEPIWSVPTPETETESLKEKRIVSNAVIKIVGDSIPSAAQKQINELNISNGSLRDILRGIATQSGLNLIVDNSIERRITIRLTQLTVLDAIIFLCQENGLSLIQTGSIFRIQVPERVVLPPRPVKLTMEDTLVSADLTGEDVADVARVFAEKTGRNLILRQGLTGPVSGYLRRVPVQVALTTLMSNNGFVVNERDGIYHIDRGLLTSPGNTQGQTRSWVNVKDGLVEMDVVGGRVADVVREISNQAKGMGLVTYSEPDGSITARVNVMPIDEVMDLLFRGSSTTYRRSGNTYFIGSQNTNGIAGSRLVRLDHIKADGVLELIPKAVKDRATVLVVKEHNGLLITGPQDAISELESFVDEIDYPTPQILIEALVVDFEGTTSSELGIMFGRHAQTASEIADNGSISFGQDGAGFTYQGNAGDANYLLDKISPTLGDLGIRKIGRLPSDFYFRIQALSAEGKAEIRSRPQIATLNGHPASISIGTTQYYILKSATPYQSPNQIIVQEAERFEKIEANVKLEITPWVSSSGEVTAEIKPEFSTPVGDFNPEIPPTINSRVLESTVRLRDGETIILGGLIQDADIVHHNKVPLLGDIPMLGRLFRSTSKEKKKSELVIYLTPHVFYGDDVENTKWNDLRERLGVSDPVQPNNTVTPDARVNDTDLDEQAEL